MTWQFWKKKAASKAIVPQALEWPADAYASVRMLLGMYLSKTAPFAHWRKSDVGLTPEVEDAAEFSTKSYQLALWFWMFGHTHGGVAARMARDALCLLWGEVNEEDKMGDMLELVLNMQDNAYDAYAKTPAVMRKITTDGEEFELPREYFIAMYLLLAVDTSPYYQKENPDVRGDDFALTECLNQAQAEAQYIFTPMLAAIGQFEPSNFPKWKWSAAPGAHERHLQRRHNNPMFRLDRQTVTSSDVYQARVWDIAALYDARKKAEEIRIELRDTELPDNWSSYLNQMRERIDALACEVRMIGQNAAEVERTVATLRDFVIGVWRDTVTPYPDKLAALEEAETLNTNHINVVFATDWLRQLGNPIRVIPVDEVVSSLLAENIDDLIATVKVLESEPDLRGSLLSVRTGALDVVRPALAAGHMLPNIKEKLNILGVAM